MRRLRRRQMETVNTTSADFAKLKGISVTQARRILNELYIEKKKVKVRQAKKSFNMGNRKAYIVWTIPAGEL